MNSKLKQSNVNNNLTSSSFVIEKSTAEFPGKKIKKLQNKTTMVSDLKVGKPVEQRQLFKSKSNAKIIFNEDRKSLADLQIRVPKNYVSPREPTNTDTINKFISNSQEKVKQE